MFNFDREELAWSAGFFDGEGYVGAFNNHSSTSCHISINQAYDSMFDVPEVLERFKLAVNVGNINGPYTPKSSNASMFFRYQCQSHQDVQHVACLLWPWLSSVKRTQFLNALNIMNKNRKRFKRYIHGTASSYTYGCRCDLCKTENSRRGREYRYGK